MTPAVASAREIYDAFAKSYRAYSQTKASYIQAVDDAIVSRFGGRVRSMLDFGAGDGVRGTELAQRLGVTTLVCGDVSGEMMRLCRELGSASDVWDLGVSGWWERSDRFDLVVSLWNVLGHVSTSDERIEALRRMASLLAPGGKICFDVNNRHNRAYGKWRVRFRRLVDFVAPRESRGDVAFEWKIDGRSFAASGHLFTKAEVMSLMKDAGLALVEWKTVDYVTGEIGEDVTGGQHFVIAEPLVTAAFGEAQ